MASFPNRLIPGAILVALLGIGGFCIVPLHAQSTSKSDQPDRIPADRNLARDQHEGLSVSADPYTDAARSKKKFGKADPLPLGLLPVEVFLTNENELPLRINLETVKLTVHGNEGRDQDIDHLSLEEVAAAVAHPKGPSAPSQRRFPIGIPGSSDSKTDKMKEILQPLALDGDVVPPMGSLHGFLFFDVSHDFSLASNASLYVPDVVKVPSNEPLMFFEVRLGRVPQ